MILRAGLSALVAGPMLRASDVPKETVSAFIAQNCVDCHDAGTRKGGLDLTKVPFDLAPHITRTRWVQIYDRIEKGEMPPDADDLPAAQRQALLRVLSETLTAVDRADVAANGRGPMRRLNREEYAHNLLDLLQMRALDIRDMLPEDRTQHGFDKSATALDMSRV